MKFAMRTLFAARILTLAALISLPASAWTPSGQISKIKRLYTYESGVPLLIVQLENPVMYCYVPDNNGENKRLSNLLTALALSQMKAEFFCHDLAEDKGGWPAHRVHRVSPVPE